MDVIRTELIFDHDAVGDDLCDSFPCDFTSGDLEVQTFGIGWELAIDEGYLFKVAFLSVLIVF